MNPNWNVIITLTIILRFTLALIHSLALQVKVDLLSQTLWPQGLYSPCNSPSQNTGLSLLQGIFPTQGLNPGLLHCRQILYQLSYVGSPWIDINWHMDIISSYGVLSLNKKITNIRARTNDAEQRTQSECFYFVIYP